MGLDFLDIAARLVFDGKLICAYLIDMSSIFTKIIEGNIPSYTIYEDEFTYAFLDIEPIQAGHTLIVPKIEVDYFVDVPEPYYSAVFQTAKLIAPAIERATGAKRIGTMIHGMQVAHFHYHLIPMKQISDFYAQRLTLDYDSLRKIHEAILLELQD